MDLIFSLRICGRLDLTEVGAREMIPLFREIVIGRIDLGGQYGLRHVMDVLSRWKSGSLEPCYQAAG
ncbi:hypothetical protein [Shinella sp. M31]|uniref:hypothetical protein n=1 Tax=Shinella sp. M31 TaxID=3368615 RepID=UPI003B9F981F